MKVEMDMPELPDGWEYTGEMRTVRDGEHYHDGVIVRKWTECRSYRPYPIVRKKPFRIEVGKWYVTRNGERIFKFKDMDSLAWDSSGKYLYFLDECYMDLVREVKVTTLEGEVL